MSCVHRSQCSFSERFSVFLWRYFHFHCSPQCASKYHFADSTRRVLANSYMNRKVELCEMNSQIRKKFLRKFFSRFYLGIFPLAIYSSKHRKFQFSDSTKPGPANSSMKYTCNSSSWIHTSQTSFSESFYFLFEYISLVTVIFIAQRNIPLQIWRKDS